MSYRVDGQRGSIVHAVHLRLYWCGHSLITSACSSLSLLSPSSLPPCLVSCLLSPVSPAASPPLLSPSSLPPCLVSCLLPALLSPLLPRLLFFPLLLHQVRLGFLSPLLLPPRLASSPASFPASCLPSQLDQRSRSDGTTH